MDERKVAEEPNAPESGSERKKRKDRGLYISGAQDMFTGQICK
jgi:hypothetical protein